jgi:serine/threonine protein kinase
MGENVTRADIEREARAADKLSVHGHQNIVSVLRHGWLDSSCYFIDMELCEMNLAAFIYQTLNWTPYVCFNHPDYLRIEEPPIWWRTSSLFRILFQISSGLMFIHQQQQVHRDLKPQNGTSLTMGTALITVIYSKSQKCWKITDFGITMEGTATSKTTTKGRGTECYRAPELISNEGSGRFSYKSDVWALGCIAYELCMREMAYRSDWEVLGFSSGSRGNAQRQVTLHQLLETPRPPLPCENCGMHAEELERILRDLKDLNALLNRILSKDSQNRPTAEEIKALWHRWDGEFDI